MTSTPLRSDVLKSPANNQDVKKCFGFEDSDGEENCASFISPIQGTLRSKQAKKVSVGKSKLGMLIYHLNKDETLQLFPKSCPILFVVYYFSATSVVPKRPARTLRSAKLVSKTTLPPGQHLPLFLQHDTSCSQSGSSPRYVEKHFQTQTKPTNTD